VIAALGARVAQPDEEFRIARAKCAISGDKLEIGCHCNLYIPISSLPRDFPQTALRPRRS